MPGLVQWPDGGPRRMRGRGGGPGGAAAHGPTITIPMLPYRDPPESLGDQEGGFQILLRDSTLSTGILFSSSRSHSSCSSRLNRV